MGCTCHLSEIRGRVIVVFFGISAAKGTEKISAKMFYIRIHETMIPEANVTPLDFQDALMFLNDA